MFESKPLQQEIDATIERTEDWTEVQINLISLHGKRMTPQGIIDAVADILLLTENADFRHDPSITN